MRDPATTGSVDPHTHEVGNKPGIEPFNKVIVSPAVGDIDGDGALEIVATVNEQYKETPNTDDPAPFAVSSANGGNQRVYALYPDGSTHGDGPGEPGGHPNANAFLPGWPARIATVALELLPVVGDGPDGSPVLGNVNGGDDLETGIFATAGPAYILGADGRSIYGQSGGLDRTLLTEAVGMATNSPDAPSIPAVGGGIFTRRGPEGGLAFAAPAAGAGKLVDVVLPEDQLVSDNHLSVWDLRGSRAQLPAFPREVNDLQFLATPASADVDGDGDEEVIEGTAYSDLHAFDATGGEPGMRALAADGWPKFTGGWTVGHPGVGDLDGDGERDLAHTIREGALFVWRGNGAGVCDPVTWPEFGHDGWTSNNVETDASRPAVIADLVATAGKREVELTWIAPGTMGLVDAPTPTTCASRRRRSPPTTSPLLSPSKESPRRASRAPPRASPSGCLVATATSPSAPTTPTLRRTPSSTRPTSPPRLKRSRSRAGHPRADAARTEDGRSLGWTPVWDPATRATTGRCPRRRPPWHLRARAYLC
jgi:hypothetical protein